MNKLEIKYFKAFKDSLLIDCQNKGILIYGENGAGKSSIYEAIKIIFYVEKFEENIPNVSTPEDQEQVNRDFWDKLNNRNTNRDFEIKINDMDHKDFLIGPYQVFMLSLDDTFWEDRVRLDVFLEKLCFKLNSQTICLENYTLIENEVNDTLKSFCEHIRIEIDNEDDFTVKIIDDLRNLESKVEAKKYFNEAKLNLVILLLFFAAIIVVEDKTKKRVLVLDDFITSLDTSNRTFIMKYIFDNFLEFQLILLTHSVSFYNLITYLINDIYKISADWNFANIYDFNNNNKIVLKNSIKTVADIKRNYEEDPTQINLIGNEIRQKFEVLLYEFSKILMLGAVEDSNKIIEHVENSKNIYFKDKKTASDLIEELSFIVEHPVKHNMEDRLRKKINEYKLKDFANIKQILNQLKLYRKVALHPMSHGAVGQTTFSTKEIDQSLILLEIFETRLKEFVGKNVSGI